MRVQGVGQPFLMAPAKVWRCSSRIKNRDCPPPLEVEATLKLEGTSFTLWLSVLFSLSSLIQPLAGGTGTTGGGGDHKALRISRASITTCQLANGAGPPFFSSSTLRWTSRYRSPAAGSAGPSGGNGKGGDAEVGKQGAWLPIGGAGGSHGRAEERRFRAWHCLASRLTGADFASPGDARRYRVIPREP
ncbi:hypothetical protein C8F04DRAFT_1255037 [Mycena alexandri]|uniref:Uncharacterized protein n=1 Tax=Mycena alexandri TaxID=1745969 RepID=A0AAD6T8M5_9AGAR|nr:hypothetical protein C8F04DRAFT_1255037 [Mycena alexandri]